jgi:transposase InsO family protein
MSADHSIARLCAAFGVSRAAFNAWRATAPSAREQQDAQLLEDIRAVHKKHKGRYGAVRIEKELRKNGHRHGRKRVARLMRQEGIKGLCQRRFVPKTTDSRHDHPIAPNRLKESPAPQRANQVWVSDLTYVATQEGWLYVAIILDLWSRRVVGWSAGPSLQACLAVAALQMALKQRRPPAGMLHHSDRGVQYASGEYRDRLASAGLQASMSRPGNPYDNGAMESFNATYKRECVGLAQESGGYATRAQAQADLFEYIELYYNRGRLHSALGYKSPVDFETQLH